ncbi:MAG: glutamate 5-kinase, partial [Opitutales bacterium]|nr:glutamate 5-kinase [Opitutales bacterium]
MGQKRRVVVKIGTGVFTRGVGELDVAKMAAICESVAGLKKRGFEVAIVSSGAVGLGMGRLGLKSRPKQTSTVQKCAAVGQGILIDTWSKLFDAHSITTAQILLTKDDVDIQHRHKAMAELMDEILKDGIVPILNENDCISASELNIKFGDNDLLSALVSTLIKADTLVILSTASGLLNMTGDKAMIKRVEKIDSKILAMARGTTSATAVGGMITKLKAAAMATRFGCGVYIASGSRPKVLEGIFGGENPQEELDSWLRVAGDLSNQGELSDIEVRIRKTIISFFEKTFDFFAPFAGDPGETAVFIGGVLPEGAAKII